MGKMVGAVVVACLMMAPATVRAQVAPPRTAQNFTTKPLLLDRVIAVVNGDVLLESDLEQEVKFAAFEPFDGKQEGDTRKQAMDRLIDRTLVEQQMKNQPGLPQISDDDLKKQLTELRKSLPDCSKFACWTDEGWATFCGTQGFTPPEVAERWRARLLVLAFIEQRFRTGIRISQPEIEKYYQTAFVPKFKEQHLPPPTLASVSQRIQEILLQQRVNALLTDWLKSLHDQGTVQILDPSLADSTAPAAS
jgi:peptidyl-prolyl cis-trans isomerase SurA